MARESLGAPGLDILKSFQNKINCNTLKQTTKDERLIL